MLAIVGIHQLLKALVCNFDRAGFLDYFFVVRQQLLLSPVRLLTVIFLLQLLESFVNLGEPEGHQVVLDQLEDADRGLKNKSSSGGPNVVPNADAQTQWKAIQEARLKPFVNPQQVWNALLSEVVAQVWAELLEENVENTQKLEQQGEALAEEAVEASHDWDCPLVDSRKTLSLVHLTVLSTCIQIDVSFGFGEQCSEHPECFLLAAATQH